MLFCRGAPNEQTDTILWHKRCSSHVWPLGQSFVFKDQFGTGFGIGVGFSKSAVFTRICTPLKMLVHQLCVSIIGWGVVSLWGEASFIPFFVTRGCLTWWEFWKVSHWYEGSSKGEVREGRGKKCDKVIWYLAISLPGVPLKRSDTAWGKENCVLFEASYFSKRYPKRYPSPPQKKRKIWSGLFLRAWQFPTHSLVFTLKKWSWHPFKAREFTPN